MKQALDTRLQQLGMTQYQLAKQLAAQRDKDVNNVVSFVANVFKKPESRRFMNLAEVVEAMGGEIVIRWGPVEEKISLSSTKN
ncbi:MAG: hypothetical protein AAGE59_31400 [Cyanobacteria bacterium P01_F01_bin.86]